MGMGEESNVMDFVNEQFKTINQKLDKLTELTEQTHLQEYRLNKLEEKLNEMQREKSDTKWRVLSPLISSVISALIAFVVAGGLRIR